MFRLLVAGGRNYYNYQLIDETLTNWYDEVEGLWKEGLTVVHGDAAGVDRIAAQWAVYNHVLAEAHPANWTLYGKKAGVLRNTEMINSGLDYAILFPGGVGTANMKNLLRLHSIDFREILDTTDIVNYTK